MGVNYQILNSKYSLFDKLYLHSQKNSCNFDVQLHPCLFYGED